jgi:hypothetical protein
MTAVIDSFNIAKPMHVGHLRSSIIGDCLQRLYRANGWRVISDVHLGDWGLQMGQLISEIEIEGIAPIYFDPNIVGPYPDESPVSMEDLETLYPRASVACKADPARLEAGRAADLQGGRPGIAPGGISHVGSRAGSGIRRFGRQVRTLEWGIERGSADPAHDRGSEKARPGATERGRAGGGSRPG